MAMCGGAPLWMVVMLSVPVCLFPQTAMPVAIVTRLRQEHIPPPPVWHQESSIFGGRKGTPFLRVRSALVHRLSRKCWVGAMQHCLTRKQPSSEPS